jgi:CubicO group peptidase (beta-lactamase class C family)
LKRLIIKAGFGIALTVLSLGCSPKTVIPPVPSKNGDYQATIDYARKYLNQQVKQHRIAGMAVAVVDSDKIIFSEGFGYEDRAAKKKVTPATPFMVGSVSKLFTSTAILQLVEQKKIALDSPIVSYIPEFAIKSRFSSRQITIRDLLMHESGLPSDLFKGFVLGQKHSAQSDTAYRTIPALLSDEYMARPPRTSFAYCNLGYTLLGNIIERVSGIRYKDYIQDSIFSKLGMNKSCGALDSSSAAMLSKGYLGKDQIDPPFIRDVPAGAIVSSTADLSRFMKALLAGGTLESRRILQDTTLATMWIQQNCDIPLDMNFKVGLTYWLNNPAQGTGRIAFHGGDITPFHAFFGLLPDSKLGVIVLVNSEQGAMVPPIAATALLEAFFKAKTGVQLPAPEVNKIVKPDEQFFKRVCGYYAGGNGLVQVSRSRNRLTTTFTGIPVTLIPREDNTLGIEFKLLGLFPLAAETFGKMQLVPATIQNRSLLAFQILGVTLDIMEKVTPEPVPAEWTARAGSYEVIDSIPGDFTSDKVKQMFSLNNTQLIKDKKSGFFCLDLKMFSSQLKIALKPVSSSEMITCGIGRGSGVTLRAFSKDGDDYLTAYGYTLRKIRK